MEYFFVVAKTHFGFYSFASDLSLGHGRPGPVEVSAAPVKAETGVNIDDGLDDGVGDGVDDGCVHGELYVPPEPGVGLHVARALVVPQLDQLLLQVLLLNIFSCLLGRLSDRHLETFFLRFTHVLPQFFASPINLDTSTSSVDFRICLTWT